MTDGIDMVYCPMDGRPTVRRIEPTADALLELIGASRIQQIGVMPGIVMIYDPEQNPDPRTRNRGITWCVAYGSVVYAGTRRRDAERHPWQLRSLTDEDIDRLIVAGFVIRMEDGLHADS